MNYQRIHDEIIERSKARETIDGYFERHHILPRSMGGTNDPSNLTYLTAREHYIIHWLLYKIHANASMAHAWNAMSSIGLSGTRYTSHSFKYAREAYARSRSIRSDEEDLSTPFRPNQTGNLRPVVSTCIDTNVEVIFDSARWAAKCVNGDQSTISRCCAGRSSMHKGYRWRYLDAKPKKVRHTGGIRRIDSEGNYVDYPTMNDAVSSTPGASNKHVPSVCKGRRSTHAGYRWEYITDGN